MQKKKKEKNKKETFNCYVLNDVNAKAYNFFIIFYLRHSQVLQLWKA